MATHARTRAPSFPLFVRLDDQYEFYFPMHPGATGDPGQTGDYSISMFVQLGSGATPNHWMVEMFDFSRNKFVRAGALPDYSELYRRVVHRFAIDPSLDPPRTGRADTRKFVGADARPLELHTASICSRVK